ncbi:MAG TPA: TIGR03435 family protein [Verrucomicrobiae bacterium]|jgi:uncharacterized protein (TIGR03435 family)
MTKTQIIAWGSVSAVLIAAAIAVKLIFFPSLSETYFAVSSSRLRTVPAGYVVVRPTHSAAQSRTAQNRIAYATKGSERIVGVNVTFHTLISLAYSHDPAHITLPWNAPTNQNYDILVTAPGDISQHLQAAIRSKLGFVADVETNEVDVMALKIENPTAQMQNFKLSPDIEKENEDMKNGRLYFTHTRLLTIMNGLEQIIRSPVVDETGLTNSYDFSVAWSTQLEKQLQGGTFSKDLGAKILSDWGLGMEPDTAPIAMLVVKKAP